MSWDAVPGAVKYQLEVQREETSVPFEFQTSTTDNSFLLGDLVAGGLYKFKVRTLCDGDKSDWSSFLFFSAGVGSGGGGTGGTCDTPTGLSVSGITSGSAWISWNAVAGAQEYEVEVEDDENTPAFNWATTLTETQVMVTGLSPNGNYQVKVKTKCEEGINSVNTDWVFFTSLNFTSNTPQLLFTPTEDGSQFSAMVAPNPAHFGEELQLKIEKTPETGSVWIMVYDLQGRLYQTVEATGLGSETINIPTGGLRPGIYHAVIRSKNDAQSKRFSLLD